MKDPPANRAANAEQENQRVAAGSSRKQDERRPAAASEGWSETDLRVGPAIRRLVGESACDGRPLVSLEPSETGPDHADSPRE